MTCDEISFGESIKSDQEISQDHQEPEKGQDAEHNEPWGASECSLQKTPTEENFGIDEENLEKISKSSSKKSFKQQNEILNLEENQEEINDFL